MGHEDELTTKELQEILNEEHQEAQRNVSPSEPEKDERGPMPTSAIKDLLKKWEAVKSKCRNFEHYSGNSTNRLGSSPILREYTMGHQESSTSLPLLLTSRENLWLDGYSEYPPAEEA
ncbi:uncharacterized protein TNCV_3025761 [Trichonephila clavipes]|nr:uncharacterized protein TNCV_3025761 [Trichonephila clavipes]